LASKLGHEPTVAEIADILGVKETEIRSLGMVAQDTISLDMPLTDESTSTLVDYVEDPEVFQVLDFLQLEQDKSYLYDALSMLHPKEEKILRMRHGIAEARAYSLDEIGVRFKLTRERIRQIEIKAMYKLKRQIKND